jgi:hypothetical protein
MTLVAKSNLTKIAPILLAVAVVLLVSPRLAEAATGTVDIRLAKVGAFVGVGRASGTLHFQGRNYPLNISGITAGTIGVGLTHLRGHAYHLRYAGDIGGNYTVASVSVAVVAGIKVARLQNSHSMSTCNWKVHKPASSLASPRVGLASPYADSPGLCGPFDLAQSQTVAKQLSSSLPDI